MVSLKSLYKQTVSALCAAVDDTSEAEYEAQLILSRAVGQDYRLALLNNPNFCATAQQESEVGEITRRRLLGEPLQYIFGEWDFYNLTFEVGEGVLIPRQDTETLVELAEKYLADGMVCADLCAGSGCIGICLSTLRSVKMYCYEKSPQAMEYLKRNIARNSGSIKGGVTPMLADVLDERTAADAPMLDIIVSNPPYLTAEEMSRLQRELGFEPEMALFGGTDGLDFYRAILRIWTKRLKSGGLFAVEIGETQADAVSEIFRKNGIQPKVVNDYSGNNRVVYGIKH